MVPACFAYNALVTYKQPSDIHIMWCVSSVSVLVKPGGRVRCQYFPAVDKVLFVDDYAVGCRKDLNGILLLDTALQPPVAKPEDMVQLELPVTEVREHVCPSIHCVHGHLVSVSES